jgi:hypothetical protein
MLLVIKPRETCASMTSRQVVLPHRFAGELTSNFGQSRHASMR